MISLISYCLLDQFASFPQSLSPLEIVPQHQADHTMGAGEEHGKQNGKEKLNSQQRRYALSIP